jgi:hypothetical protein
MMRNRYNLAAVLSAVVLVCCGALILGQKVNAAGEGKITGTVKLDGTAPHMKGIDMSKDPYCSKATPPIPRTSKRSWSAPAEDWRTWFSTSPTGAAAPPRSTAAVPVFDQKKLCVHAARVGDGCGSDFQGDDQRSDHAQHSPDCPIR